MTIKEQISNDIKTAMLAGEKERVTTLRGIKSAILYAEVAKGARDTGLPEDEVVALLQKESKKRQDIDITKQIQEKISDKLVDEKCDHMTSNEIAQSIMKNSLKKK